MSAYDAIIIGTGQSGKPLAITLARAGWKIAVIEREHVGGTCINVGCTPTKTLVASARVAYLARRARDYGVDAGAVKVERSREGESSSIPEAGPRCRPSRGSSAFPSSIPRASWS